MYLVYVEDNEGWVLQYQYKTRAQARAHIRRVNNNIFLQGWNARGNGPMGTRL